MTGSRRGRPFLLVFAAALAVSGVIAAPAAEVRAAAPDLSIVSAARYDVQPAHKRVRVTVDLTLANRLKDTKTRRYFFDHAFLAVLPGASGYRLTWDGAGQPSVSVARKTATHTLLRLNLARDLASGRSAKYRLTFDLKDPGGKATRDLRIGDTLVSFPVWAFASDDTPGSSVTVIFPKGYDVAVEAGRIPTPDKLADGRTVFRSGILAKPLDFFAYLVADRPGAYVDTTVTTTVQGRDIEVVVRAWTDDRTWAKRVTRLLDTALPALGARIGLPWPDYDQPMIVQEAVSRSTGGYAGIFDPAAGTVAIAYYADDFVVLHEAAHAWFNGALLADRWSNEAFASYYGALAAADTKVKVAPERLDARAREGPDPAQRLGPGRDGGRHAGGLRLRRVARAGPADRRARRSRRVAGGLGRCVGQAERLSAGRRR